MKKYFYKYKNNKSYFQAESREFTWQHFLIKKKTKNKQT